MPGTIIHKALLATLAVWLFGTSPVLAQELPHRKAKRVAVLPVQRLDIPCDRLFTPEQREDFDGRAIERSIQDSLARLPDVKLLSNQELRKRITGVPRYRDQVVIGRERYLMGHEYYRDLRQQDAETSLQKSTAILENIYYDIVEPHAFSQVLFLLGITLVEVSKAADAHQIFKRALMLSPSTSFTPGYHPQPVEQAMSVACEDLRRSTAREIPLTSIERTVRFMKHNKLSTLVYPVLIKEKDEHELLLIVFERSSRTVTFRQRLPMTDKKSNRERISRAISGWAACEIGRAHV